MMKKLFLLLLLIIVLLFNSCSKPDDSVKKEKQKKDSIITSYFLRGIEEFNKGDYNSAKYYFEDFPDSNKYYSKAQEYLRVINDSLEVYRQNTLLLINQMELFIEKRPILDDILYDSLIAKGIFDEERIKEIYRDEFNDEYEDRYQDVSPDEY